MKMRFKRRPIKRSGLTDNQVSFFLLGWVSPFWSSKFPFRSEDQRRSLWQKHKDALQKKLYLSRTDDNFRFAEYPDGNQIRPEEWYRDRVQPRRVIEETGLHETDLEYLERTGLLTDQDREYMQGPAFQEAEKEVHAYREYCRLNP